MTTNPQTIKSKPAGIFLVGAKPQQALWAKVCFMGLLICLLLPQSLLGQVLKGCLPDHAHAPIRLVGYAYTDRPELGKTTADSLGNFSIAYPNSYTGMALLESQNKRTILILNGNSIELNGTHLGAYSGIQYLNSPENTAFLQLAKANAHNDDAYMGLRYLKEIYSKPYFNQQSSSLAAISSEIERLEQVNMLEQHQLLPTQYLYWYAPLRKLLSDMPQSIQRYTERIPEHIAQFNQIDFTHPNFKTSGIFNELITGYYVLLENMSQSQTVVCTAMNTATSSLMAKLKTEEYLLNLVAEELFRFFEQGSLFQPAAHLAELLLNSPSYHSLLQEKLQQELQKYLALKVGNTAPDIFLSEGKKLSDLKQQVLLVFGASDCPACKEEALQLVQYTNLWKEKQRPISVVYISLDTDKERFNAAFAAAPFERYCDYKGWDSEAAKAYYVSATPSYFLLDKDLKIELQPTSVAHANEWMQAKR